MRKGEFSDEEAKLRRAAPTPRVRGRASRRLLSAHHCATGWRSGSALWEPDSKSVELAALRDFAVSSFVNDVVLSRQIAVEAQVPSDEFLVLLLHDDSPFGNLSPSF